MSQSPAPDALTVRDLQSMAAAAAAGPLAAAQKARSRSANLHLIDLLSRWGGSGLAAYAAATIFVATTIARGEPLRAGVWASIVFAALYLCRRYRKEFRRGDKIASRPFRWRAYYTSTLAVVSSAFGAGAFLLALPAAGAARIEIFAVLITATLAAAAFHTAYRQTALAAVLPASVFIAAAAIRADGVTAASVSAIAILFLGVAGVLIASRGIGATADRRFPRTGLVRREIERAEDNRCSGTEALARAKAAG